MSGMDLTQVPHDDEALLAWDWIADLRADDRTVSWLARKTGRPESTVHSYAQGRHPAPLEWLREAAFVLKKDVLP